MGREAGVHRSRSQATKSTEVGIQACMQGRWTRLGGGSRHILFTHCNMSHILLVVFRNLILHAKNTLALHI